MNRVVLTERRAAVRRLRRADVAELLRDFRNVVEVLPTFERGVYRLAARGYVGGFRTANVRWEIRPKLPWDALPWLAAGVAGRAGDAAGPDYAAGLANLFAGRLAELVRARAEAGLVRDYAERETEDATVRGRIDFPRQARGPQQRFHLVTDEFTPDVVWNRVPLAAARRLLAVPGLAADARARLLDAVGPFAGVLETEPTPGELDRLRYDARTEAYRPLVGFCRLVLEQFGTPAASGSAFLVNLEHLFQYHVGERLARPGVLRPGWGVTPQAELHLLAEGTPAVTLRPDLLVRDAASRPRSVWDVKWKSPAHGPLPADVHQVLGYAAALGVPDAGLIYPGRRFAATTYRAPGGVRLRVVRLRLTGPPERRERAVARLARLLSVAPSV